MSTRPLVNKDGTCAHTDYLQEGSVLWCRKCGAIRIMSPLVGAGNKYNMNNGDYYYGRMPANWIYPEATKDLVLNPA